MLLENDQQHLLEHWPPAGGGGGGGGFKGETMGEGLGLRIISSTCWNTNRLQVRRGGGRKE